MTQLLTSPAGAALLASLPPYDPAKTDELGRQLRRAGHPGDLVAAVLTQQRLRSRAVAKLGEAAATMLFTEAGLQQATRAVVANLHARRYLAAGVTRLVDLTCGIGADVLAFAQAGLDVLAVELDPETAALARRNLAQFPGVQVVVGDSLQMDVSGFDAAFADPARRSARGRTFNPDDYSPPLSSVLALRDRVPALGVKVAPGIAYSDLPPDVNAQWISVDGDVVEAGLWFGPLGFRGDFDDLGNRGPGRSALVLRGDQAVAVWATDDPRSAAPILTPAPLGRYLYEPDGAVIRCGGLGVLADQLQAAPVSEGIAYLTGDALYQGPLAATFEVLDVVPMKQVRAYVRDREIGSLEILKRGFDVVPDQFRRGLKLKGPNSATVILTRLLGRHSAVFARRV